MPPVKAIFGLRVTTATAIQLTPSEFPDEPGYPLTISEAEEDDVTVNMDGSGWSAYLETGDYILRIELPTDEWFGGTVSFESDQAVQFITHTDPEHSTIGWTSKNGLIGGGDDPKDPWPPPDAELDTLSGVSWFTSQLHTLRATISNPRDAPPPPDED